MPRQADISPKTGGLKTGSPKMWIGVSLAAAIMGAWAALFVFGVFQFPLGLSTAPLAVIVIALQVWLYAGLFIIAHDTMHGSLLPRAPRLNAVIGQLILTLYAGFNWRAMRSAHHQHHKTPGSAEDPDFNAGSPHKFSGWYLKWFLTYFGWPQMAFLFILNLVIMGVFKAQLANVLLFWALPALLSSLQLFYFGTYLPHRHREGHISEDAPAQFPDHHNARTNQYPWLISLLTCFHFGYHHEHHLHPQEPWWRLPYRRRLEASK